MKKPFIKLLVVGLILTSIYTAYSFAAKENHVARVTKDGVEQTEANQGQQKPSTITSKTYPVKATSTTHTVSKQTYVKLPTHSIANDKKGTLYLRGDKTKKLIALTFDDGPDRKNTPAVLDVLKKYNVKATFFVVGKQVERFPRVAERIVAEGHEIGNHSYSHAYFKKENLPAVKEEILKADAAITKVMGIKTTLVRPPYGIENPQILSTMGSLGYDVILWTVDTDDWKAPPVTKLFNYEINHAETGAIILMHSGEGQKLDATVKALPMVITTLRKKGYEFATVSQVIGSQEK